MRVLVTGASPGIGGTTALLLARRAVAQGRRASIAVCEYRETPELLALKSDLERLGAEVATPVGDLADPAVPARLVGEATGIFGGLDAVVSNAGITGPGLMATLDIESWDRLFAVNVRAAWLLAKAAYPALKASRGGFVAVASMSGMLPHHGMGAYSASKAALIMLVRQLAQEWAADGIRVNSVSPGLAHTPLTQAVYADAELAAARSAMVPMQRVAQPVDIAGAIAMLLSSDAGYCTGQNLLVDGAFSESILGTIPGRPASKIG
ncbi:MAG: SDR family NAD(P)-dependent oxidoreductase [Alphaproteobacteria bacterium]